MFDLLHSLLIIALCGSGNFTYLHPGSRQNPPGNNAAVATDGVFLYSHSRTGGLLKIGTGFGGSLRGVVYAAQTAYRYALVCPSLCVCVCTFALMFVPSNNETGTLAFAAGRLYYRSPAVAPAACVIIDPATLVEVGAVQGTAMPPAAQLGDSGELAAAAAPLFSDGAYLYVVHETQSAETGRGRRDEKRMVCEMYDPGQNYAVVRRVELQLCVPAPQHQITCSGCGRTGFNGDRYKCTSCSDLFQCSECKEAALCYNTAHTAEHVMEKQAQEASAKKKDGEGSNSPLTAICLAKGAFFTNSHTLGVLLPQSTGPYPGKKAICRAFDMRDGVGMMLSDVTVQSWTSGTVVLSVSPW